MWSLRQRNTRSAIAQLQKQTEAGEKPGNKEDQQES